jgi:group I intron endonuclease
VKVRGIRMTQEKISAIYCIENLTNGKKYIGKSNDIRIRWTQHRYYLKTNNDNCIALQNAYNKYGKESFIYGIIEECEYSEIDKKEIYYIELYKTRNPKYGYNILKGGEKAREGIPHTKETREKMSRSMDGRRELYRDKWLGEKNPNYGKPLPEETIKKMLETMNSKTDEEKAEWRAKIVETRKKNGKPSANIGKKYSEERKQQMSDARMGKQFDIKKKGNETSKYRGVSYRKDRGKYRAYLFYKGKQISLGLYENEIDAAKAYNKKALELYGEDAILNITDEYEELRNV